MQHIFYVSESGSDKNIGTKELPFASLQKAVLAAKGFQGERTIFLRGGTYFLKNPICLGSEDSGITICAYENEKPRLTGAVQLEQLSWQKCEAAENAWTAQIEAGLAADMLFINGNAQIPARYPNKKDGAVPLDGAATADEIKKRSKTWKTPQTGRIRALHAYGWGGNDYLIEGLDDTSATGLSLKWIGDNNRGSEMMKTALVAENIFEELDAAHEWFYDAEKGLLYYVAPNNLKPCGIFTLAVNAELLRICGESIQNPVHDITIKDIEFMQTARTMFSGKPYIPLQRGDWAVTASGAVYLQNCKNAVLKNLRFEDTGGNAVFLYGYNEQHRISSSEFCHTGASCVQIIGDAKALWQPSYWQHEYYPQHPCHETTVKNPECIGAADECYPHDITIENNHMYDIGIWEKQSAGVNLSVASRIHILHCTIHKSARSCINVNDGSFGGHEIAYNDIFNAQTETLDHGPFNSWGRDRFWSVPEYHGGGEHGKVMRHYKAADGNIYDITCIDAYQPTRIHHNRFHHAPDAPHTWGIDLDDGSSNYEISYNLCLGMGIKLREGFSRRVYNNIIIDGKLEMHVSYAEARDTVFSNIIVNKSPLSFVGVDSNRFRDTQNEIANNLYFCEGKLEFPEWVSSACVSHSLNYHCLIGENPNFEDVSQNNYTVQNEHVLSETGFKNFDMNNFGKQSCALCSPVYTPNFGKASVEKIRREEWHGAFISEINDAIISATGSFGKDGVYFEAVPENSDARRIGFCSRDILKSLNGAASENLSSFYNLIAAVPKGSSLPASVHRGNKIQTIHLNF